MALSRVKNFNDFLIESFPLEKLNKMKNSISLSHRINKEEILDKITNKHLMSLFARNNVKR